MLEIVIRRYYSARSLSEFRAVSGEGLDCITTSYAENGKRVNIFILHTEIGSIGEKLTALSAVLSQVPANDDVVLDVMAWDRTVRPDAGEVHEWLHSVLMRSIFHGASSAS